MKLKITKRDLNTIKSLAKNEYIDGNHGDLDEQEFLVKCWIKAINTFLGGQYDFEFPKRLNYESVDED